ncbi:putative membrane protein [Thermosporothrix hazakensis]|jgi:uncharacterized membrane protein|uniref:Putative membrane protein n=2 Tax=Thermosporothrix hazakensis TaxID=644383 RepID=A0A326UNC7_THEHA|nr:DUF2085 domain-containing protein [Thermosporothrix hazakensis]PZW35869.1 putative membrane protein [Thermosporothrix hazakensis]GCE46522.1 hypothetical protein KTH_13910 [Thermosporothrix hazakensis]
MTHKREPIQKAPTDSPTLMLLLAMLYLGLLAALLFLPEQPLLERLRWLDSGICAQQPGHTLHPGGIALPLCARDTGIYLGLLLTVCTLLVTGRGKAQQIPPLPLALVLAGGFCLMATDGLNSLAVDLRLPHLYPPHNLLRLATGLLAGLAIGSFLLPVLNQMLWSTYHRSASIPSWRFLFGLLPLLILAFFAAASQHPLTLYPLALLSTAGLLTALGSLNLLLLVLVRKRSETFVRYKELLPYAGIACLLSIGEMLLLAQGRFWLLQTLGLPL